MTNYYAPDKSMQRSPASVSDSRGLRGFELLVVARAGLTGPGIDDLAWPHG